MAQENFKKGLEPSAAVTMFRLPLIHLAAEMLAAVKNKGRCKKASATSPKRNFWKMC